MFFVAQRLFYTLLYEVNCHKRPNLVFLTSVASQIPYIDEPIHSIAKNVHAFGCEVLMVQRSRCITI